MTGELCNHKFRLGYPELKIPGNKTLGDFENRNGNRDIVCGFGATLSDDGDNWKCIVCTVCLST